SKRHYYFFIGYDYISHGKVIMTNAVIINVVFKSPKRQRAIFAFFNSSVYQIELNISYAIYCQK
ncbi:hypothetical protein CDL91_23625, partial [Salmonella enterica subsp. enterica serovar Typhi]|nr:hypothetical protein [Salmonella enterica subsp. enterica serovar Enteritidis]EAN3976736.1 hypothetical protein [Salmonella enterica]EGW3523052.1 hypothetical protein [Salmonella enterica subsp. enterica serovar Typhi]EAN6360175.1 hypothetical protein [Salmonella enterica]EAP7116007.1 hypothetical protein [Salmonella enterica]